MGSILHHITPLVINNLGGGHTHKHTSIQTFADSMYVCMCVWYVAMHENDVIFNTVCCNNILGETLNKQICTVNQ